MSYELQVGEVVLPLATINGWKEARDFIEANSVELRSFVDSGYYESSAKMKAELRRIVRNAFGSVEDTLLDMIGSLDDTDSPVLVASGFEPDDGKEQFIPSYDPADEPTGNAFCATGAGGGVDPSCSPGQTGGGGSTAVPKESTTGRLKALADAATAKLKGVGKTIYDKLPAPAKKVVDMASALHHKLEATKKAGQELAKAVAKERGLSDKHVERVGRILNIADNVNKWASKIPAVGHPVSVALHHIGGPVGVIGHELANYVPAASLAYVGYSMGREALSGRNPLKMISAARERVGKTTNNVWTGGLLTLNDSEFAAEVLEWFGTLPDDRLDWAEALLVASLDEANGDKKRALELAKAAYDPEEDLSVFNEVVEKQEPTGNTFLPTGSRGGHDLPTLYGLMPVDNAFCPTGPGGGQDNSCSPSHGSTAVTGGAKSTEDIHKVGGQWSAERKAAVHEPAIQAAIKDVPKATGPKTVYMTGGGSGSGKSVLLKDSGVGFPQHGQAVHSDPDEMKAKIPEYKPLVDAGDKNASVFVHEESADMAREAANRGLQTGRNVVYDTTGDSGIDKLAGKVDDFRKQGAERVESHYAFPGSVAEAQARADARGEKTGRYVPPALLQANHASVSKVWMAAAERGTFDKLHLWSTAGPQGSSPTPIATAEGGKITIHDPVQFKAFREIGETK